MRQFERKIYLGILFIVIGFVPIIAGSFWSLRKIVNEQKELISSNSQEMFLAQRLAQINATKLSLIPVYVLSGNDLLIKEYRAQSRQFDDVILQLLKSEDEPISRAMIFNIRKASDRMHLLGEPGIRMRQQGASAAKVNEYFSKNLGPASEELQGMMDQLIARESADMENAKTHLAASVNWVIGSLVFLLLIALGLFVFIGRLIVKMVRQKVSYDESQQALLDQERRLSQARKEAVEVVAHDLKNPLGTIKMSVALVIDEISENTPPEELKETLQIAYRSSESMERLIKDLLDHAKIEAGQLVLEKNNCDVGLLALDLVKRFQPLAQRRNISLTSNITSGLLMSHCDLGRIEQVLSNLIGNALKFTSSEGHVAVEAEMQGDSIWISVTDDGVGLTPEQIPHVFDRFWQVGKTADLGHGLGLAIAKAIIDAHGGEIWVDSGHGKGSKFCISLPRSQPSQRPNLSPTPLGGHSRPLEL